MSKKPNIHTLRDYKDNDEDESSSEEKPAPKSSKNKTNNSRKVGKSVGINRKTPKVMGLDGNLSPPIKEEPKYRAFAGKGKKVSNVNTIGLKVNKFVKPKINKKQPTCKVNIRLFNGTIVNAEFNLKQTLKDIKRFVELKSGSHNFSLLEGFPPRVLNELNQTIEQLNIQGSLLTQKIK